MTRTCARQGCGERFEAGGGIGVSRPRRFCSDRCRQHEYRAVEYLAKAELAARHAAEYKDIRYRVAAERAKGGDAG